MDAQIRYIQLDSSKFLTCGDFIAMPPAQRGVYMTLILLLYVHSGSVPFKPEMLYRVCNCADESQFVQFFNEMKHLFRRRGRRLTHPWVTEDLRRAREYKKKKSDAGKKGMASRWAGHNTDITKENEVNEGKDKSTSYSEHGDQRPFDFSFARETPDAQVYELYDRLQRIINPVTRSDRTALRNITKWAVDRIRSGSAGVELAPMLLGIAGDVTTARNPRAAFMAMVKKELHYSPKTARQASQKPREQSDKGENP